MKSMQNLIDKKLTRLENFGIKKDKMHTEIGRRTMDEHKNYSSPIVEKHVGRALILNGKQKV